MSNRESASLPNVVKKSHALHGSRELDMRESHLLTMVYSSYSLFCAIVL